MSFLDKQYRVYVILSSPVGPKPWTWKAWREVAELLAPYAETADRKAALRTTQLDLKTHKKIAFGKLGWDEKSHIKWSHESPFNENECSEWSFLGAEAWSPSWSRCSKTNQSPDFFLSVNFEHEDGPSAKFGATVIAALSISEGPQRLKAFSSSIQKLTERLGSPLCVTKQRAWAEPVSNIGFTKAMNDLGITGLFKAGRRQQRPLDLETFAEPWEHFLGTTETS